MPLKFGRLMTRLPMLVNGFQPTSFHPSLSPAWRERSCVKQRCFNGEINIWELATGNCYSHPASSKIKSVRAEEAYALAAKHPETTNRRKTDGSIDRRLEGTRL